MHHTERTGVSGSGSGTVLVGTTVPLENRIEEKCYVYFNFNGQGLPIKKSDEQKYHFGNNILYIPPKPLEAESAATFGGTGDQIGLFCIDPETSSQMLGVLACIRGRPK